MKKNIFLLILYLVSINTYSQNLNLKSIEGIWVNEKSLVYTIYDSIFLHYYSLYPNEIVYEKSLFGFYDNCEPENIKDLRKEGTGEYFFILGSGNYNGSGRINQNLLDCWSVSLDNYRNREDYFSDSLYLHFSRRTIIEYKKIDKLPKRLVSYIKKEQPSVYSKYVKYNDE